MRTIGNWMLGLGVAALCLARPAAQGPVQHLPISVFLDGQVWAVHLNTGLGELPKRSLVFDAFGTQARLLGLDVGTSFDGSVDVRELSNGRLNVSVHLNTQNGICWGEEVVGGTWTPAFGYSRTELDGSGLAPSLGDGLLHIEFTMPSPLTLPLPKMQDLWISEVYRATSVDILVRCEGTLRGGSGYPELTPGRALMNQIRLIDAGANGRCAGRDCWPVELIEFWPTAPR